MASLRSRLLAGLLALSALGLLALGLVTYLEQRSFLLNRIDQQLRAAPGPIAHALFDRGIGPRPGDEPGPPSPGGDGGGPPPRPSFDLPPGTYGELRDASGNVVGSTVLSYGQNIGARPALPATLPPGEILTVGGRDGVDTRFKVRAQPGPSGRFQIVVALPLREADQTLHRLLLVEALVIGAVLLALALAARSVIRVGLAPLDRIEETAGAIAAGDLSHRVAFVDERTEVGRLGAAFNGMLDRLEKAFSEREESEDRLRQFLADASHELRTPLASIRGYAELFRMGATKDPIAAGKSARRIEEEAARMGVLVEDLLTLARLDEVAQAPMVPVALGPLAADAVQDAQAAAPDREIALATAPGATVLGDEAGLRQVLGNLLGNALAHTPAATRVEVSLSRDGQEVLLIVRDHGPGLGTADPDTLFDRFWRAAPGRGRGKAGAGLGLAIVAAIVAAHGGSVRAEDADGGGARFTVILPSVPAAPT